jgi:hypothetical protein
MNKTKRNISLIIEILLMFSIMLAVLSIFFRVIVLNKNTYITIINKNNTYEQVKELIYDKIDVLLSAKNINYDIKESIITDEDIKNEADNVISGLIEYLKTGENNIEPIDIDVYKKRLKDIIGNIIKPSEDEVSFNSSLQTENVVNISNHIKFNNMVISKEKSEVGQDEIQIEKLMSRSEAEAKVRELLDQKGLTVEEAIEKANKKGITEEQALKILAGYGITIDDDSSTEENESSSESSDNSNVSNKQVNDKITGNTSKEESSNSETENIINQGQADKSVKSQLDMVLNKLIDQAGSSIEKEIENINLYKILESSKLNKLTQITSIFYKMFWVFMILPIIFIIMLVNINAKKLKSTKAPI